MLLRRHTIILGWKLWCEGDGGVFMFPAGRHGLLSIMDRHLTIELVTFSIDKKKRGI